MSTNNLENIRIILAIRTARSALGLSQNEFADLLEISKVSLARIETLETPIKADVYMRALRKLKELGISVDTLSTETIHISIEPQAQKTALERLEDESRRRSDRKSK